jgi:hypothetical protein
LFLPENIPTATEAAVGEVVARAASSGEAVVAGGVDANGRDPALVTAVVFYLLARGLRAGFLM